MIIDRRTQPLPMPDVTGLSVAAVHRTVFAAAMRSANRAALAAGHASPVARQAAARVRILDRHAPETRTRGRGIHHVCPCCSAGRRSPIRWPCPDYHDTTDGLVEGMPACPST